MFKQIDMQKFTILRSIILLTNKKQQPVFRGLRTTQAQTSLRIRAPMLFAYWKESYLDLLQEKFHFSS